MKNKLVLIIGIIVLLVLLSRFAQNPPPSTKDNSSSTNNGTATHSGYTLPITQRNFYMDLAPTPKNSPNSSFDDITKAYEETGKLAEISMIWVEKQGIGEFEKLKQNGVIAAVRVYGLKPVVTLNFATIKQGIAGLEYVIDAPEGVVADLYDSGFRSRWITEARNIAQEFKPEYFSLGNEINDYFYLHPEQLNNYLSPFDEAKAAIKSVSPNTKVFAVFSYTHLIDNAQWGMLRTFDSRADLIGLTSYPRKQYDAHSEIPADYYSRISQYTSKMIAFTEIGWISSAPGSEKQQSEFKILGTHKSLNIEIAGWLFLHEVQLTGVVGEISDSETGTIALKKSDGTKKDIYSLWLDLKELKRQ